MAMKPLFIMGILSLLLTPLAAQAQTRGSLAFTFMDEPLELPIRSLAIQKTDRIMINAMAESSKGAKYKLGFNLVLHRLTADSGAVALNQCAFNRFKPLSPLSYP